MSAVFNKVRTSYTLDRFTIYVAELSNKEFMSFKKGYTKNSISMQGDLRTYDKRIVNLDKFTKYDKSF